MLPNFDSPDFPEALRARREALKLSQTTLAKLAGISTVMPVRYEKKDSSYFTRPSYKTWVALNKALGYEVDESAVQTTIDLQKEYVLSLKDVSLDKIAEELQRRGIKPTFEFVAK